MTINDNKKKFNKDFITELSRDNVRAVVLVIARLRTYPVYRS